MDANNYLLRASKDEEGSLEDGRIYPVIPIVNYAHRNLKPFQLDITNYLIESIVGVDNGTTHLTIYDLMRSYDKILTADLSYPIVLTYRGTLFDGNHRLVKAVYEGMKSIPAYKLPGPICDLDIDWNETEYYE